MTHPAIYRLLPALMLIIGSSCRDAQRTTQDSAVDTAIELAPKEIPVQGSDSGAPRARVPDPTKTSMGSGAADVVRRYYDAIKNSEFDSAYALWDRSGEASGQTRAEFENGFRQTNETTATIGDSVTVEGAAGSQYATVPVTVDAVLRSGARQRFVGSYTLRRSMVDGATREQRTWHIYSAHLQQRANP